MKIIVECICTFFSWFRTCGNCQTTQISCSGASDISACQHRWALNLSNIIQIRYGRKKVISWIKNLLALKGSPSINTSMYGTTGKWRQILSNQIKLPHYSTKEAKQSTYFVGKSLKMLAYCLLGKKLCQPLLVTILNRSCSIQHSMAWGNMNGDL